MEKYWWGLFGPLSVDVEEEGYEDTSPRALMKAKEKALKGDRILIGFGRYSADEIFDFEEEVYYGEVK